MLLKIEVIWEKKTRYRWNDERRRAKLEQKKNEIYKDISSILWENMKKKEREEDRKRKIVLLFLFFFSIFFSFFLCLFSLNSLINILNKGYASCMDIVQKAIQSFAWSRIKFHTYLPISVVQYFRLGN